MANATPGADGAKPSRVRFDLTVNVPTLLTIAAFVIGSTSAGLRIYSDLETRVTRTEYDLSTVQERFRTVESTMASIKSESNTQIQTVRNEIRADLAEIKGILHRLMLDRPPLTKGLP